jgi:hypothetical protein
LHDLSCGNGDAELQLERDRKARITSRVVPTMRRARVSRLHHQRMSMSCGNADAGSLLHLERDRKVAHHLKAAVLFAFAHIEWQ